MSTTTGVEVLAAVIAVVAAALLGGAGVAQRRAMPEVGGRRAGDPRLIGDLARRGWWWAGTLCSVLGLGLQVLALSLGPIMLVQSTMTSSIASTTLTEWAVLHRRPPAGAWWGMALTAGGLLDLLLALAPTPGGTDQAPSTLATLTMAGACAAVMALAVGWDRRGRAGGRGLGLAVATGLGYGVTAVLLKAIGGQLAHGLFAPLAHPALWVALVLGPTSILLSQSALQRGRFVTAVVSLVLVVDPVVGLAAGVIWFGERVSTGPSALATAAVSALVLVAGIVSVQTATGRTLT